MSNKAIRFSLIILSAILFGVIVASIQVAALFFSVAFFAVLIYIYLSFKHPLLPLKTVYIASFFVIGLTRYIDAPFGLAIDILLVFSWVTIFLKFKDTIEWKRASNFFVIFISFWFFYIVLELLNPLSIGAEPWFYAMRGMALYPFLIIPLVFLIFNKQSDMMWLFKIWFVISLIAAAKGFMQKYVACDPFEKRWLDQGGAITHVLFGQLRAFSFYSDAGQFGGAMAQASITSFVLFTGPYSRKKKFIFFLMFIIFFWGYLVSGTRGAIAVVAAGILIYLLLSKNFKSLIFGSLLVGGFYYFMAFTQIGQGTYEIRRLRTAFTEGSEDASMLVRKQNKEKLAVYLANKPFGGGVASAGDWGKRYRPDSVLANIATDSFYVRLWSETGIVGLVLYLIFFFYFIIKAGWIIWFMKEPALRNKLLALYCGIVGIMVASYSNSVFSQFPTSTICYTGMCFILIAERYWIRKDESTSELNN